MSAPASPLPKPVALGESPSKAVERTPSPQMMHMAMSADGMPMHSPFPTAICPCPTCEYYRAAMMYYQDAQSPNIDSYNMYQSQMMMMMSPMAYPMMMPQVGFPMQQQQNARQNSHSTSRGTSPTMNHPTMPSASTLEAFEKAEGKYVETACTSAGRSMLQCIMGMQHVDKIEKIFDELIVAVETVMLDQHGCHVIRSLIEVIDEAQVKRFVDVLDEKLILNMCTVSQYTRRILQALFETHKTADLQVIVEIMHNNAQYLSATQQGCISLMRVYEQCSINQKMHLLEPLRSMLSDLAMDPFGNYVVQCVLENSPKNIAAKIILDHFNGCMLKMSCNKFASNVMEKIINNVNVASVRRVLLDELIFNPAALQQMVHDGYGNFVIQTIIESCNHAGEFKKISDRLRSALPNSPFGHKIEIKMRNKRFTNAPSRQFHSNGNRQTLSVN